MHRKKNTALEKPKTVSFIKILNLHKPNLLQEGPLDEYSPSELF